MFLEREILGDRLPRGTVCLTYDDGPGRSRPGDESGPRTAELGAYLRSEGIPATFFAVGRCAEENSDILGALRSQGHLVANHTYDHPSLPAYVAEGHDAVDQLLRTDQAIAQYVDGPVTFFRPPYGDWRLKGARTSNVAAALNRAPLAATYVGPIGWDIDAGDVGFWRDDRSAQDCADAYVEAVKAFERGIVLMHDSTADIPEIRRRNRALELTRLVVPKLRECGYQFVRLDAVPEVVSASRVTAQLTLASVDGRFLAPGSCQHVIFVEQEPVRGDAIWGIVPLSGNRCALRASNGLYLSVKEETHVGLGSCEIGERDVFAIERQFGDLVSLRAADGRYLGRNASDEPGLITSRLQSDRPTFRCAAYSAPSDAVDQRPTSA